MQIVNCRISDTKYSTKPKTADFSHIHSTIENGLDKEVTIEELADAIEQGRTYLIGHLIDSTKGRKEDNLARINAISLDIDNEFKVDGKTVYTNNTIESTIEEFEHIVNVKPCISYTTFSGVNSGGTPKFRLIYMLDSYLNADDVKLIQTHLMTETSHILDESCKTANKMFLGTNKEVDIHEDSKPIDTSLLLDRLRIDEIERRESFELRRKNNPSDKVADQIVAQDMIEYLYKQGYELNNTSTDARMKCPIHKGSNPSAFSVNLDEDGIWKYNCFSCNSGGTIIQLHQALNNLNNYHESLEELKAIYGIKTPNGILEDAETITIAKHISEDTTATTSIIESVNTNKKTLVVAPMGSGKSYFIMNRLYQKLEDEVITIQVIPNTIQLDNMKHKYNIPVIHSKSEDKYQDEMMVATTPESLPNLILEIGNRPFVLIVDETHQKGIDLYRDGYRYMHIDNVEEKHNCKASLHLTATPTSLAYEHFDKVIKIESNNPIKNNIRLINVDGSIEDNLLSMVKEYINKGTQVVLFNDNIEVNEDMKEQLLEYKKEISIELVNSSSKHSENVKEGFITADVTITTSSLMAGIDLETTKEDSILIANTINKNVDNMTQLIGRFRKGIKVDQIKRKSESEIPYKTFEDLLQQDISTSEKICQLANEDIGVHDSFIRELDEENLVSTDNSTTVIHCLMLDSKGKWIINQAKIRSKNSERWSRSLYQYEDKLIEYLKEQSAFEVVGDIEVVDHVTTEKTIMKDIKKMKKEDRKERKEELVEKLIEKDNLELMVLLEGNHTEYFVDEETLEEFEEYKQLAKSDLKHIKNIHKCLFRHHEITKAFKKFYSEPMVEIKKEIAQVDAREINKKINNYGMDLLLKLDEEGISKPTDVRQCKIRYILQNAEKKQLKITDKRLDDVTKQLIKEGNLGYGKLVRNVIDKKEGHEKDFISLRESVRSQIEYIYNFKKDGKISSIKM